MAADARGFVMELFRISNEIVFADHMTKCCILIGRAKNVLIIYAENGRHVENSARFVISNVISD